MFFILFLQSDDSDIDVETNKEVKFDRSPLKKPLPSSQPDSAVDLTNTFPVHISIERAFHLPNITENRSVDFKHSLICDQQYTNVTFCYSG